MSLAGIPLDKKAASYLSHGLGYITVDNYLYFSSLKVLNLERCKVRGSTLEALVHGIQCSKLEKLNLGYNKITSEDISCICNLLESNHFDEESYRGLKVLNLSGNEIQEGIRSLSAVLSRDCSLEKLLLQDNKLTPAGLVSLAESLVKT